MESLHQGPELDSKLFQLSSSMTKLHQQSQNWQPEGQATFIAVNRPLMVKRDNLFSVDQNQISPDL